MRAINNVQELKEVVSSYKLVLIDVGASWCGPCKMVAPVFDALSKDPKNKGVFFAKVDVDDAVDVANELSITSVPTFILYVSGKPVARETGASADTIKKLIQKALGSQ